METFVKDEAIPWSVNQKEEIFAMLFDESTSD